MDFIREAELFEGDGDLDTIWGLVGVELDVGLLGRGGHGGDKDQMRSSGS